MDMGVTDAYTETFEFLGLIYGRLRILQEGECI